MGGWAAKERPLAHSRGVLVGRVGSRECKNWQTATRQHFRSLSDTLQDCLESSLPQNSWIIASRCQLESSWQTRSCRGWGQDVAGYKTALAAPAGGQPSCSSSSCASTCGQHRQPGAGRRCDHPDRYSCSLSGLQGTNLMNLCWCSSSSSQDVCCHAQLSLSSKCLPLPKPNWCRACCCCMLQMTTLTGQLPQAPGWLTSSHPGQFVRPATTTNRQPAEPCAAARTRLEYFGTLTACACRWPLWWQPPCSCLTHRQDCACHCALVCAGAPTASRWSQPGKPSQQLSSHTTSKWQRCVRQRLPLPKTQPNHLSAAASSIAASLSSTKPTASPQ